MHRDHLTDRPGSTRRLRSTDPAPLIGRARKVVVGLVVVGVATIGLTLPAWAHVEAELGEVSQSGLAEITFGFHHGCDGQATTGLRIEVPDGVSNITLEPVEGFTTNVSATEFGWTGGSVPDGDEASFILTAQLTGQEGDVIAFPTIQQCGSDEIAWVEAPEGGSEDETEHPAPAVTLPATYGSSISSAVPAESTTTSSTIPSGLVTTTTLSDNATPETSEGSTAGLVVFLVVVAILIGGAAYLYFSNRRPKPPTPSSGEDAPDGDDAPQPPSRSPH